MVQRLARLAALVLGAVLASSPAHAEWKAYETRHFIIYSESPEARATELATRLESYDKLMRMATNIGPEEPVKVRIYEVPSTDWIDRSLGLSGSSIAGYYTSNVRGPYLVTPRKIDVDDRYFTADLVLRHEYAHHFMLQYFPATYPSWYTEGFAELIGSSTMERDGTIRYGEPARHRGNDIVANWVPLQELLARDKEATYFDRYAQGWAITQYLTLDPERAKQLRTYLSLLGKGVATDQAAVQAFGDLRKLNDDARRYASRGSWIVRPVKVEIEQPVIRSKRALSPAEAALVLETISLSDDDVSAYKKASDREKELAMRRANLQRIKDKMRATPNDVFGLGLMADAAAAIDDLATVDDATRRLLALDANDMTGLVRRSLLLSQQAKGLSGPERAAKVAEARQLALKANKIDPDAPMPMVAFYQSFNLAGEAPTANAVLGLTTAMTMLPRDNRVRMLVVDEFARQKKWVAAMNALAPLANSPHDSPLREKARERMAQLRAASGTTQPVAASAS